MINLIILSKEIINIGTITYIINDTESQDNLRKVEEPSIRNPQIEIKVPKDEFNSILRQIKSYCEKQGELYLDKDNPGNTGNHGIIYIKGITNISAGKLLANEIATLLGYDLLK